MSVWGLNLKDIYGNALTLTPDMISIVSSGRLTMPSTLQGDGTYGTSITLPGSSSYVESDLGIILFPFILNINVYLHMLNVDGTYRPSWMMNNTYTYYTRNTSTGVLSTWTPDVSSPTNRDSIISIYPVAFWDKMGASTFSSIRLFAAMCYEIYDISATAYLKVYSIGVQGVEKVDYSICTRHYTEI